MSDLNPPCADTQEDPEATARFHRDELVRGWREYEQRVPRVVPLLKYAAKTDMGQLRENNEDKFDYYEPEVPAILATRGSLFAVADGVGGALAGQIASELMLKTLITAYYDHPAPDLETALRDAITEANDRIYTLAQMIPERNGMGTTLTAAIFVEDRVVVAQLGDSRAYLIRGGTIRQVTQDHSWVEEQVRAGLLSRTEAEMSPFRNVITRSIGAAPTAQPDLFTETCCPGDIWVLCTDGLTGHVEESEILQVASRHAPSEAARQLIELANGRGGRDNITVFVIAVRDFYAYAETPTVPEVGTETVGYSHDTTGPATRTGRENGTQEAPRSGWRRLFGR